jgi:GNAT superfamily N-acetyltransferase
MTEVVVRRSTAEEVRPLRSLVLRGHPAAAVPAYDEDPVTVHVGAYAGDLVVGCASVFPEAYEDEPAAWHLRGMAVDPAWQGEGVGRLVLTGVVAEARSAGAPLLWANGRVQALGFYERLGWQVVGEQFIHGESRLPHKLILLPLIVAPAP